MLLNEKILYTEDVFFVMNFFIRDGSICSILFERAYPLFWYNTWTLIAAS